MGKAWFLTRVVVQKYRQSMTPQGSNLHTCLLLIASHQMTRAMTDRFPMDTLQGFSKWLCLYLPSGHCWPGTGTPVCSEHSGLLKPMRRLWIGGYPLFGGKSAGLSFCRSQLGAVGPWHLFVVAGYDFCVDDMPTEERTTTAQSSYCIWRQLARLCGWDVPVRKSRLHSASLPPPPRHSHRPSSPKQPQNRSSRG